MKFGILHNAYKILSNPETKEANDSGNFKVVPISQQNSRWDHCVKTTNAEDIETARKNYQGSLKEENDIIRETIRGKGSMTHLFNEIPFMRVEDENRIIEFIRICFVSGRIPKMPIRKLRS